MGPGIMDTIMNTVVLRRRNFVSGFPRLHEGESISAGASKEDGEEEGGGKNGCHRVIGAVCVESQGNAETISKPKTSERCLIYEHEKSRAFHICVLV
jgi:hypothetical protein